jgi:hypothetical protein
MPAPTHLPHPLRLISLSISAPSRALPTVLLSRTLESQSKFGPLIVWTVDSLKTLTPLPLSQPVPPDHCSTHSQLLRQNRAFTYGLPRSGKRPTLHTIRTAPVLHHTIRPSHDYRTNGRRHQHDQRDCAADGCCKVRTVTARDGGSGTTTPHLRTFPSKRTKPLIYFARTSSLLWVTHSVAWNRTISAFSSMGSFSVNCLDS